MIQEEQNLQLSETFLLLIIYVYINSWNYPLQYFDIDCPKEAFYGKNRVPESNFQRIIKITRST